MNETYHSFSDDLWYFHEYLSSITFQPEINAMNSNAFCLWWCCRGCCCMLFRLLTRVGKLKWENSLRDHPFSILNDVISIQILVQTFFLFVRFDFVSVCWFWLWFSLCKCLNRRTKKTASQIRLWFFFWNYLNRIRIIFTARAPICEGFIHLNPFVYVCVIQWVLRLFDLIWFDAILYYCVAYVYFKQYE